jgi:hypothetical protein
MNIFLAVTLPPDGKEHGKCSMSILKNCIALMRNGHTVVPYSNSDLYIDRSRNLCINLFLDSECSDVVFVDTDLEFDDDAILKLIKFDKDIVAGAYRYKKETVEFPITLDFSRNNNCKEEETGLVFAKRAPTGLMRINRNVFGEMVSHYKMVPDERGIYPFFETGMVFENDNNWYGEDSAFCKKWVEMGGEIFVEPRINFTHIGTSEFSGNYHEYLLGRSIERIKVDGVPNGIPGWMTETELSVLKYLASKSTEIIEVGSWKGRSTKELLKSCKGTVYAVDHWKGTESDTSILGTFLTDVYQEFMNNVGHYPNLKVLKGYSKEISNQFNGKKVDMVFIDAGHTYEDCKADIEAWFPKCLKIMAGHDYSGNFSGVIKAVSEKFRKVNVVDSVWWVEL